MSALVQQSTKDRNTVASELAVGDFVLFDAHDDEVEPIWLGRVMPNPEWNGQGVYANNSGKNISFRGVAIGRREVAIYVMWYEKLTPRMMITSIGCPGQNENRSFKITGT